MTGLLLLLLAQLHNDADSSEQLKHCIATRDRACLTAALKASPGNASPEYLAAAAEAYLLLGKNQDAKSAIAAAVNARPGDYGLLMQQGRTLQRCGDQVEAIQSFLLAAKVNQSSDVFYSIGLSFFFLHEYQRAEKHFAHSVQLDNKNHKAEFMLGAIDILKDNNDAGAKTHFEQALAIDPKNPHYLLHYGIVLMQRNDREGAAVALEKAEAEAPSNPLVYFNLGRLHRQMGDMKSARTELEKAVQLRPDFARAYYQLAAVYRALGESAKAKEATERFLKFKSPDEEDDPVGSPPAYALED